MADRQASTVLETLVHELVDEVRALRTVIERVEQRVTAGSGPRDGADQHLLSAIAALVGREPFVCRRILDAAVIDLELQQSLRDADIDNTIQLGHLFARCVTGGTMARVGRGREGTRWRVTSGDVTAHRHAVAQ